MRLRGLRSSKGGGETPWADQGILILFPDGGTLANISAQHLTVDIYFSPLRSLCHFETTFCQENLECDLPFALFRLLRGSPWYYCWFSPAPLQDGRAQPNRLTIYGDTTTKP
jgi:hypothetical protein